MPDASRNPFLEARNAGLSPIPVDTSTKRPLVRWAQYQDHAADFDECVEWGKQFDEGRCGIGVVCGAVSGRLICIDIEAPFVYGEGRMLELAEAMRKAGCHHTFTDAMGGYMETTASGGLHILVRLEGEGPTEGNRKLISTSDGKTLAETRGEGGYVIIAPSVNGANSWSRIQGTSIETIRWLMSEEWAAVAGAFASLDEAPTPPPTTPTSSTPPILRLSEGWIDDAKRYLPSMAEVLTAHGWTQIRGDSYGTHWVRPDKDPRAGNSASVNHESDRLWVHTTSTKLPTEVSLDVVDVLFAFDHGRAPSLDERTEYLRALRPLAAGGAAGQAAEASPAATSVRLDDAFWQSATWLRNVRSAAWARGLSPSGVLGALISSFATTVPMGIWLPAVWGERAPLNMYCCLVGQSGSGKTASMRLALDLLGPIRNPDILLGRQLRSGEGLPRIATKPTPKGSKSDTVVEPSYRNAIQVTFDEGGALGKQAERSGATVIPYLNTAWAGHGMVGGAKANEDGFFPADLVRVCALIGVQFGAAANLFTGESAALGFPQRLLFFGLSDPSMMEHDVDKMSMERAASIGLPSYEWSDFVRHPVQLEVDAAIAREIRLWTQNKEHGSGINDPLDGHLMQLRLRLAGIMALIQGEYRITDAEWDLSRQVTDCSRQIRTQLLLAIGDVSDARARALGRQDVIREDIKDDAWLAKRAKRITAYLRLLDDGGSMSDVRTRLDSTEKKRREEILAYAIARGWVIHRDNRYFAGGENRGGERGEFLPPQSENP